MSVFLYVHMLMCRVLSSWGERRGFLHVVVGISMIMVESSDISWVRCSVCAT
jgi:hypothetical protein